MKKQFLITAVLILSFNCYSQIKYEPGYFIDNEGKRIDCLIKNNDWKNNPVEFTYKLLETTVAQIAKIKTVAEFGILNISKYKRFTVDIDTSSSNTTYMSRTQEPEFKKEQVVFLKPLIEGKSILYFYEDANLKRFFYSTDNLKAEQLIYKTYLIERDFLLENNTFKKQLWNNFKCEKISISYIEKIRYTDYDLTKFFITYNQCQNAEFINYKKKQSRNWLNLSLRPGLNRSSLSIRTDFPNSLIPNTDKHSFGSKTGLRLGLEAELIAPFNKNKWAVIIEPTFQSYKSEILLNNRMVIADYKSIELPVGIRHFLFLADKSKIFINGSYVIDIYMNSKIDFGNSANLEIKSTGNAALGLGYNYKTKYSLEIKYQTSRDLVKDYHDWKSYYKSYSIVFGYNIF
jgi:hypothetical protein